MHDKMRRPICEGRGVGPARTPLPAAAISSPVRLFKDATFGGLWQDASVTKSDPGEFLRDTADRFFRNARDLFARRQYDLAAFNLEQSSQLFLNHALWKKLGDFEKVRRISLLLADFREVSTDKQTVDGFIATHKEVIAGLELACIESRYLPAQFFEEQVQRMINFWEQLKAVIQTQ